MCRTPGIWSRKPGFLSIFAELNPVTQWPTGVPFGCDPDLRGREWATQGLAVGFPFKFWSAAIDNIEDVQRCMKMWEWCIWVHKTNLKKTILCLCGVSPLGRFWNWVPWIIFETGAFLVFDVLCSVPPIRGSPKIAMKLRHITTNMYNINYYHSIVMVIIRVIEYKSI